MLRSSGLRARVDLRRNHVHRHRTCRSAAFAAISALFAALTLASSTQTMASEPHGAVRAESIGTGPRSYWLFEPAEPKPERAPVIVFCHGWLAINPGIYGGWIDHLVRNGHVVIYPRYQESVVTSREVLLPNVLVAVRDAFDTLESSPGHVRPIRDRFAVIGHSAGASLAAQLASVGSQHGLPRAKSIVAVMPGDFQAIETATLEKIDRQTLLAVAVGDRDRLVGDLIARQIFAETRAIAADRKLYIYYQSDFDAPVAVIADHVAPTCYLGRLDSGEGPFLDIQKGQAATDLLDRFGFWRMTDLVIDAGDKGWTLADATRDGRLIRDLGSFSNGHRVREPIVQNTLDGVPRVLSASELLPQKP
jgi:acetyl esterase/lipase